MLPPTETLAMYGAGAATVVAVSAIALKMLKKGGEDAGREKAEKGWFKRAVQLEWMVRKKRDPSVATLADQLDALDELSDKSDSRRD